MQESLHTTHAVAMSARSRFSAWVCSRLQPPTRSTSRNASRLRSVLLIGVRRRTGDCSECNVRRSLDMADRRRDGPRRCVGSGGGQGELPASSGSTWRLHNRSAGRLCSICCHRRADRPVVRGMAHLARRVLARDDRDGRRVASGHERRANPRAGQRARLGSPGTATSLGCWWGSSLMAFTYARHQRLATQFLRRAWLGRDVSRQPSGATELGRDPGSPCRSMAVRSCRNEAPMATRDGGDLPRRDVRRRARSRGSLCMGCRARRRKRGDVRARSNLPLDLEGRAKTSRGARRNDAGTRIPLAPLAHSCSAIRDATGSFATSLWIITASRVCWSLPPLRYPGA